MILKNNLMAILLSWITTKIPENSHHLPTRLPTNSSASNIAYNDAILTHYLCGYNITFVRHNLDFLQFMTIQRSQNHRKSQKITENGQKKLLKMTILKICLTKRFIIPRYMLYFSCIVVDYILKLKFINDFFQFRFCA